MKLSLIIPCYNEAENLPLLLERCKSLGVLPDVEVILVDNGSIDGTQQLLEQSLPQFPGVRSVRVEINQGYGFGILAGLRAAKGDYLGWTHADLQTDPLDILNVLDYIGVDQLDIFIKGRRYGRPWADVLFTVGMSVFETILLGARLWDINAQPTVFSRRFFLKWDNPPHDFSLDLYAYFMARRLGLKIHRFPVRFGERAYGVSHWNVDWASKYKFIRRTVGFSLQLKKSVKS